MFRIGPAGPTVGGPVADALARFPEVRIDEGRVVLRDAAHAIGVAVAGARADERPDLFALVLADGDMDPDDLDDCIDEPGSYGQAFARVALGDGVDEPGCEVRAAIRAEYRRGYGDGWHARAVLWALQGARGVEGYVVAARANGRLVRAHAAADGVTVATSADEVAARAAGWRSVRCSEERQKISSLGFREVAKNRHGVS